MPEMTISKGTKDSNIRDGGDVADLESPNEDRVIRNYNFILKQKNMNFNGIKI